MTIWTDILGDFEKFDINEDDYCMALVFLSLDRLKEQGLVKDGYEVDRVGLERIKTEAMRKGYPVPSRSRFDECMAVIQNSLIERNPNDEDS